MSVVNRIEHYQRSLERATDSERTLHCISKLYELPVTVQHLKVTGVGRTVNALRKYNGSVGNAAKALVSKWKSMVVNDDTTEDEDEACVPDDPESYSDSNTPDYQLAYQSYELSNDDDDDDEDGEDDEEEEDGKADEEDKLAYARSVIMREYQKNNIETGDCSHRDTTISSSTSENSKPRETEGRSSSPSTSNDRQKYSSNGEDRRQPKAENLKSEQKNEKKSKSSRESKAEGRSESSKESSSTAKLRASSKLDDSKKDSRVSSSGSSSHGGGTTKNSSSSNNNNNNPDSQRKRRFEPTNAASWSNKRRKTAESLADDERDDSDQAATQILSPNSEDETGATTRRSLPSTSMEMDSEGEASKTKMNYDSPASPPPSERGNLRSIVKSEKSPKTKPRERSEKATTASRSEKSRRDSENSERSKFEKTVVETRNNEKRKDRSPNKESPSKSRSHSCGSSSSSKNQARNKDKEENSETARGKKDNKSDCDSKDSKNKFKEPKDKKVKKKKKFSKDDSIDSNSGASFAEALGMCTDRPVSRKKASGPVSASSLVTKTIKTEPSTSSSSSPSSSNSGSKSSVKVKPEPHASTNSEPLSLLAPNVKLEPLNVDLASTLPEISPNYKPLPAHFINPVHRKQEESRALSDVIYAKTQRTKVYSGMKSGYTSVPTLCEEAIRVLIENIHELGYTGGIPYDIIKPVLERATPDQLFTVENYNHYLIDDTDQLWQFHCNREFRTKKREEMESWRDMYLRCREEREAKLKALTANIKESIDKSVPVRSAKLAYVDKPPRNVLRQQAKYGTAKVSTSSSDLKKQMILSGSSNSATNISVPPPPMARSRTSSSSVIKKNKAPLMAKALQLIKGRYKR